jgi:hypothetical protein
MSRHLENFLIQEAGFHFDGAHTWTRLWNASLIAVWIADGVARIALMERNGDELMDQASFDVPEFESEAIEEVQMMMDDAEYIDSHYGKRKPKKTHLHGAGGDEAPPFISTRERTTFDEKVDATLRAYGFEPGLSPIAEKWTRMGRRTVLVARIHSWSPHLVEFYLEGAGDSRTGPGRLIEAGRSDEKTFKSVAHKFTTMQDQLEGAGSKGLAGINDDISNSCDMGAHERCSYCVGCGCHQA